MRSQRWLAIVAIGGLLAAAALVDLADRPQRGNGDEQHTSVLAAPVAEVNTWFCPGGSGPSGIAELTVQLTNASDEPRAVTVSVLPGSSAAPALALQESTQTQAQQSSTQAPAVMQVAIEPRGRELLRPSEEFPDAHWVGAMVEARGSDVLVEQIVTAPQAGVGRSPCLTRVSDSWVVSNGATRSAVEGERFVVMLLNPFPDAAVADIELVADVGRDSIEGLVIPAQRVLAVDVTFEVTVAATVAAFIDVVSGRVAASWIQVADGPVAGRGTRTAPAIAGYADVWHLPVVAVSDTRRDVVAVSNPSTTDVAEVDLEVVADAPGVEVNPIEITVRPGRTALVDLAEQGRLAGIGSFGLVVRSLTGLGVAASVTSAAIAHADAGTGAHETAGAPDDAVVGATATIGADSAARRWLVPAETPTADPGSESSLGAQDTAADAGPGSDPGDSGDAGAGALVITNPSALGIAEVAVRVDGELVRTVEIAPGRSRRLALAMLTTQAARSAGRFLVQVDSSAPVVVGRELVGLTSRSASLGVAVQPPVRFSEIR